MPRILVLIACLHLGAYTAFAQLLLDSISVDSWEYADSRAGDAGMVDGHWNIFAAQGGYLIRYPVSGPGKGKSAPLRKSTGVVRVLRYGGGLLAWANEDGGGFGILDPSLAKPVLFDTVLPYRIHGLELDSGRVYLALGDDGIGILDPGRSGAGRFRHFPLPGSETNGIRVRKGFMFIGDGPFGSSRLRAYQIAGDTLAMRAEWHAYSNADMEWQGDSLIVAGRDGSHKETEILIIRMDGNLGPRTEKRGAFGGLAFGQILWKDTSLLGISGDGLYRLDKKMVLAPDDTGLVATRLAVIPWASGSFFALSGDTLAVSCYDDRNFMAVYKLKEPIAVRKPFARERNREPEPVYARGADGRFIPAGARKPAAGARYPAGH